MQQAGTEINLKSDFTYYFGLYLEKRRLPQEVHHGSVSIMVSQS